MRHEFVAPVLRLDAPLRMHYVPLPPDVADALLASGTRRVVGTLSGVAIDRAIQGRRDGERFLAVSRTLMREARLDYGDLVEVAIEPHPDPDTVSPPEELAVALEQDDAARARWTTFTPGKQRSLCHYVDSAKRPATRVKRALELAHKIATHTLHGDGER